jgi:hypothetical protein
MSKTGVFFLFFLFASSSVVLSTDEHVSEPPGISSHLTLMGFQLGKTTLADVQARLGDSKIRRCSREEEASEEICYVSANGDHTRVIFEAGFSGGWTELAGYKIISGRSNPPCYRRCTPTALVSGEVHSDGGLRIGLTRQQVAKLLGNPARSTANRLTFQWNSRRAMTKEEIKKESETFHSPVKDPYWDAQDTFIILLEHSRVIQIRVSHTVTY